MLFNSIFGRKNSTSSTSSKGVKLNKKNHQPRSISFEPLESRDLLTVTTGSIDDADYDEIRAAYPEFELPELQADLNVMTITPDDGALSLADLKSAIETAGTTTLPDLILIQTSADANSVTYASAEDQLSINIDSTQYGSVTILGWGEEKFTIDANQQSRVISISGDNPIVNFENITFTGGYVESTVDELAKGAGLYVEAGQVTALNCLMVGNEARALVGPYGQEGTLNQYYFNQDMKSPCSAGLAGCTADGMRADIFGSYTAASETIRATALSQSSNKGDNYGYLWTGFFKPEETGSYGFWSTSDDIANIWIDLNQNGVFDSDEKILQSNVSTATGSANLESGIQYAVAFCFQEGGGSDYYDFRITPPNGSQTTILGSGDQAGTWNAGVLIEGLGSSIFSESGNIILKNTFYDGDVVCESGTMTASIEVSTLDDELDLNYDIMSLREAISYAPEYATITFADELDGTIVLSLGQLEIDKSLTIDGDNRITIDADQMSRVFYIDAGTEENPVVIENLTIQNGSTSEAGGGINVNSGNITIVNSLIANNASTNHDGGGIYNRGTITIINSEITGNTTKFAGGGIFSYGTTNVINSAISDNQATTSGGGIYNNSSSNSGILTVSNSSIAGNKAQNGGGIYNSSGNINITISSTISGNTATSTGGGIYVNSGNIQIADSIITGNTNSGTNGGGIYNQGTTTLTNSEISGNAARSGGGIYNNGTISITSSIISGNTTVWDGAGIYNGKTATIVNSILTNNRASGDYGGGIYNESGTLNVINCTITGNKASSSGGGIIRAGGTVNVKNSILSMNYARIALNNVQGGLSTNINNIFEYYPGFVSAPLFDSNYNVMNADTMDLHLRSDSIAIDKGDNTAIEGYETDIEGNNRIYGESVDIGAYEYQGDRNDKPYSTVVNTLNDSFDLDDDEWSLREAIYYAPEYVTITFADELEGTLVLSMGQLRIDIALVIDGGNRITIDGNQTNRVIYVNAGSESYPVQLENLTIQNGNADNGGGIYVNAGYFQLANSTITSNTATSGNGAGIYNKGITTIINSEISGNTAKSAGGGLYNAGTVKNIISSSIIGNTASNGGGIYITSGYSLTVSNSTLSRNTVSGSGGGIFNYEGIIVVNNSIISENTAAGEGGGICTHDYTSNRTAKFTITNSLIYGNSASSGGAIRNTYDFGNSIITIINCTIVGNKATSQGGGIFNSRTANIYNSIISMNYASNFPNDYLGNLSTNKNNFWGYFPCFVCAPTFDSNYNVTNADTIDLHLRSDSTAIDMGDSASIEGYETDMDGAVRIYGETVDIGAYEYQGDRNDEPYSTIVNTLNDSFDFYDDEWSLREAIYYASEYTTITFADELEGTLYLSQGQIIISKAVAIDGGNRIVIDADQKNRIFNIAGGSSNTPILIENLTVQNGYSGSWAAGGGITNSGFLTLDNVVITGNTATSSGGGINSSGTLNVLNSTITNNTEVPDAYYTTGGGGVKIDSGTAYFTNCIIVNNKAGDCGGIYNYNGVVTITDCNISQNTSGAIFNEKSSASLTVVNSKIYDNSGSGINNTEYGRVKITSSTISGNTGYGIYMESGSTTAINSNFLGNSGGGILNRGTTNLTNCTIVGNALSSSGNGIANYSGIANLYNSIIVGNSANNGNDIFSNGGSVNGYNSLSSYTAWNGSDNQIYDSVLPLFVNPAENDYRILMGSQAFNKGNNDYAFSAGLNYDSTDMSGHYRFADAFIDIGAFECYSTAQVVNLNKVHTGKFTGLDETNYWTFTADSNTTISFDLLSGSYDDISVSISGGSEFAVLTAETDEITLTNGGAYFLKLTSMSDNASDYAFRVNTHTTQEVSVDQVIQGTMVAGRYSRVYEFTTEKNESLQFILSDLAGNNRLEMYLAYGRIPTRLDYDMSAANDGQAVQTITTDFAPAGTYYVLVYGDYVPVPSDYTLEVNSTDLRINEVVRNVLEEALSEQDDLVLLLDGFWMEDIANVELISVDNEVIPAQSIEITAAWERLNAVFDSSSVKPGTYAVKITNASGKTTVQETGFIRPENEKGEWKATVDAPSRLNNSLITQVYVTYTNTGNIPVIAPVAKLSAKQGSNKGAFLTLDSSKLVEFSQNRQYNVLPDGFGYEVSFLADGEYPGLLLPGESVRFTVYYAGWLNSTWDGFSPTTFTVSAHLDSETTPINWENRLFGKLTEEERAEFADYLEFMTAHLGATQGEHVVYMNQYAVDHYNLESHANDADYIEERLIAIWDSEWNRLQEDEPNVGNTHQDNVAGNIAVEETNVVSPETLPTSVSSIDFNLTNALNSDLEEPQFYLELDGDGIKVTWNSIDDAEFYKIYVSDFPTFEQGDVHTYAKPALNWLSSHSDTISTLQGHSFLTEKTYYFKMTAVFQDGEEETYSTSAVKGITFHRDSAGLVYVYTSGGWEVAYNHLNEIDSSKYTYVIIHGNNNSVNKPWIDEMASAIYRQKGDSVNILAVDWGRLSTEFFGIDAWTTALRLPYIAKAVEEQLFSSKGTYVELSAEFETFLGTVSAGINETIFNKLCSQGLGLSPGQVHLIGHSHGAHIAGLIGNIRKVDRITALDASEEASHIISPVKLIKSLKDCPTAIRSLIDLLGIDRVNLWGLGWGTWSADFVDFYKSSRLFGGETAWGHDNFLVTDSQISTIHVFDDHSYAYEWFTRTILAGDDSNRPGSRPGFWWTANSKNQYLTSENGVVMSNGGWIGLVLENSVNTIQGMTIENRWYRDYSTLNPKSTEYELSHWYCQAGFSNPYDIEKFLKNAYEIQFFPWDKQIECGAGLSDFQVTVGILDNLNLTCVDRTKVEIEDVLVRLTRTGSDSEILKFFNVSKNDYYNCTFEWDVPTPEALLEKFGAPETDSNGRKFYELNMYVTPGVKNYTDVYPSNDMCCMKVVIYLDAIVCKACDDQKVTVAYKKDLQGNVIYPDSVSIKLTGEGAVYKNGEKENITGYSWYDLDTHEKIIEKDSSTISPLVIKYEFPDDQCFVSAVHNYRLFVWGSDGIVAHDDVQIILESEYVWDEDQSPQAYSRDPNELVGPSGNDGWIYGEETLAYQINFENDETASAPAQRVDVEMYLDEDLDWSAFQFTGFGWADVYESLGNGVYSINKLIETEVIPLGEDEPVTVYVEVTAGIDLLNGRVYASFQTLQYTTLDGTLEEEILLSPMSANIGFLLPSVKEDGEKVDSRGDGFLTFIVKAKEPLETNTEITSVADIQFDYGEIIATNQVDPHDPSQGTDPAKEVPLKIDVDAPEVQLVETTIVDDAILLQWSGSDVGSGIYQYQIYVSSDDNIYTLWNTFEGNVTSAIYESSAEGEYSFYILAVDAAGNVGGDPEQTTPPLFIFSKMDVRIVKDRNDHASTDEISENLAALTDWDDFYMEFWTEDVNEFASGKTYSATINYDSTLFVVDVNQTIVTPDGVTAEIVDNGAIAGVGLSSVTVTFTVGNDGYTASGANTYWGAVHFTPNLADDAGVQNVLEPAAINVTANGKESGTTVKAMPFDLDHNNAVDVNDFIAFATAFGKSPDSVDPSDANYAQTYLSDFDGSGVIDVQDFIAFATNYGIKKGSAANYYIVPKHDSAAAQPAEPVVNEEELIVDNSSDQLTQPEAATQSPEVVEVVVTVQEPSPEYLFTAQPMQTTSVQTLQQAYSTALLDLYDNQNELPDVVDLSAPAIDEALYQDDEFDFLFDESDLDSDDSSNSDVDLSVVLDELEL